jgi:hypothetical protein
MGCSYGRKNLERLFRGMRNPFMFAKKSANIINLAALYPNVLKPWGLIHCKCCE